MVVCQNCFCDKEIRSIIKSLNNTGSCDICKKSDYTINSEKNIDEWNQIIDYIYQIKEIYSPEDVLPKHFPEQKKFLLSDLFSTEWKIINAKLPKVEKDKILQAFLTEDFDESKKFGNSLIIDNDYLKNYSILGDSSWNDFVDSLKHKNRFHSDFLNKDVLEIFCRCFEKYIPAKSEFLRGRIAKTEKGLNGAELEAPPKEFATAGRANSEGISRLYLADTQNTVLKEIRAGVFDFVSIAKFEANRNLLVVDFTALDEYSPYSMEVDINKLAVNKENLDNINIELGKPMRRTDNLLDYVPTQYLIDFIESIRDKKNRKRVYDGVMYKSVMNPGGVNLVVFDTSVFSQSKNITTLRISSVTYSSSSL